MDEQSKCYNCGSESIKNFCPECGQSSKELNPSFLNLIKTFLGDIFSFDSKVSETIKLLLFKPGFLSKEYILGKRAKYVYPSRLYIFISIICFTIMSLISFDKQTVYTMTPIVKANGLIQYIEFTKDNKNSVSRLGIMPDNPMDPDNNGIVTDQDVISFREKFPEEYAEYTTMMKELSDTNAKNNLDIDIFSFFTKCLFLLLPLFAMILKIFHLKQTYMNQVIFLIHNHIFVLLLITLTLCLSSIGIIPYSILIMLPIILILGSIYIIISSYNFYAENKFKTIIKYFLSLVTYICVFWISLNIITLGYMYFGTFYEFIFFS